MGFAKKILQLENDRRVSSRYNGDIAELAKEWAVKTVAKLKNNIEKKGIVVTGELLDSLEFTVNEGNEISISISFASHGQHLDMKKLFWHKHPPHDKILKWVEKVPLNEWGYVPGYKGMNGIDVKTAQSRIAWGIIYSRRNGEVFNQFGRWKRKKMWQNPSSNKKGKDNIGTAIGHLRHLIEEELAGYIEDHLIQSISNK